MWTIATYQPSGFFSLRPTATTSSGGQTLLFPTPFAIKMALLDAAIRGWGVGQGQSWWPSIRDLEVGMAGPPTVVVNNTFIKIWRSKKNGPDDRVGTGLKTPLNSTIAFRAFTAYTGPLQLALSQASFETALPPSASSRRQKVVQPSSWPPEPLPLAALLAQLNYFGKRGGFFQLLGLPQVVEEPNFYHEGGSFVRLTTSVSVGSGFSLAGTLQPLDDCVPGLSFAQVNVYDPTPLVAKKDRLIRPVVLPYEMVQSSRSYQLYRRLA